MKSRLLFIVFSFLLISLTLNSQVSKNAAYFFEMGQEEEKQNRHIQAIELYKKSLALNQNFAPARLAIGRMFRITGAINHATENLNRAHQIEPENLEIVKELILFHLETGNVEMVNQFIAKATALSPYDSDINYFMAISYLAQDKIYLAGKKLESVLKMNPNHFNSMVALAEVYLKQKSIAKGETYFHKAMQIAPENPQLFVNIARIQTDQAIAASRDISRQNTQTETLFENAMATLQNAIAFQADYIPANSLFGKIDYLLGKNSEAKNLFETIVERQNLNNEARYYLTLTDSAKSLQHLITLLNQNQNDDLVRFFYQKKIKEIYDRPLADKVMQQARYHFNESKLLLKSNLYNESFFEARLARRLSPEFIEARKSLLDFYRQRKDFYAYEKELLFLRKATQDRQYLDLHEQLQRNMREQLIFSENIPDPQKQKSPTSIFIYYAEPMNYLGNYPNAGEAVSQYLNMALEEEGRLRPTDSKLSLNLFKTLENNYPLAIKNFANPASAQKLTELMPNYSKELNNFRYSIFSQFKEIPGGLSVTAKVYDHIKGTTFAPISIKAQGKGFLRRIALRLAGHFSKSIPFYGKIIKIQGDKIIINLGRRENLAAASKLFVWDSRRKALPLKIKKIDFDFLAAELVNPDDLNFIKTGNIITLGK